ncbi:hypothetical protein OLMES_2962 [Oleiphilus messinensis]|uniref:Uncharacterized protein n=1 Tax=Oleiphilus messinensis TaxID=141451 RepID=A0A1Y0IB65_9GAMM|nr:hypothetical protein OLMES_2962 [Oleiphilus messinensis]
MKANDFHSLEKQIADLPHSQKKALRDHLSNLRMPTLNQLLSVRHRTNSAVTAGAMI